jgi:chromosome segregation ATPase
MTTITELDDRVSKLEHSYNRLTVKVDAMNWAIGQTDQSTETMRLDIAGLHVGLADLEAKQAANTADLKAAMNLRSSELQQHLGETAAALRHDTTRLREMVSDRFEKVDERFHAIDERFERLENRVCQGLDEILTAVRAREADNPGGGK